MAWDLEIHTFMVYSVLLTAMTALLLLSVWRGLPKDMAASLRWWLAGLVLHLIGYALVALRGRVSDWASVVLANTLLAAALAAFAIAIRRFHDVPDRRWRLVAVTGLVALVCYWFAFVEPSRHWRVMIVSVLLAVLLGSSARGILRRGGPRGANALATATLFVLGAGLMLYRAFGEFLAPLPTDFLFDMPTAQRWCLLLMSLLPVLSTVGFLLMCAERGHQELERVARLDHLTGSFNRRAIDDLLRRAITQHRVGQKLALMLVDVDHFKRINDVFGHEYGDLALIETVRRIRSDLRADDLVGRMGGEEFVVVMPATDGERGYAIAERIRRSFADSPMQFGEHELLVTVSVGVAVLGPDDTHFSHLLRRADRAMYAAKHAGRNRVMLDGQEAASA